MKNKNTFLKDALTEQELHNLAMNIVGKHLEKKGYEFIAINSELKKHPQFVLYKKNEPTIFVLVKATTNLQDKNVFDPVWLETFKNHAQKNNAEVWSAVVGLANATSVELPVIKNQPYYVAFDDVVKLS